VKQRKPREVPESPVLTGPFPKPTIQQSKKKSRRNKRIYRSYQGKKVKVYHSPVPRAPHIQKGHEKLTKGPKGKEKGSKLIVIFIMMATGLNSLVNKMSLIPFIQNNNQRFMGEGREEDPPILIYQGSPHKNTSSLTNTSDIRPGNLTGNLLRRASIGQGSFLG
jgi:hypothetical protein